MEDSGIFYSSGFHPPGASFKFSRGFRFRKTRVIRDLIFFVLFLGVISSADFIILKRIGRLFKNLFFNIR